MNSWSHEQVIQLLNRHYRHDDEVVGITMERISEQLSKGKKIHGSVESYAFGIAKRVRMELDRKKRSEQRLAKAVARNIQENEPAMPIEELFALMKHHLAGHERALFKSYFIPGVQDIPGHRARLAKKLGLKPNTLAQQAGRLLKRLQRAQQRIEQGDKAQ